MPVDPNEFIITRKRKKYKFALFTNSPLCFEFDEWHKRAVDVIEVGAGTGLFGVELATTSPNLFHVCVDVKADRLQKGARLAEARGLTNIAFVRARADQITELFEPATARKLWVTFPDPFPRTRSSKHRLTHPRFLELYGQLLQADGGLYFKTDAHMLFEWSLEQLVAQKWLLQELSFDLHESTLADEYKFETTYEQRFRREGMKISFVQATKGRVVSS